MMKELSYHILDIANNSVRAGASEIKIEFYEDFKNNQLRLIITDNGKGIEDKLLKDIKNPFTTSRKLRNVGLGIPFLNDTCNMCDGFLNIDSTVGVGTTVFAQMAYDHIDRPPMGNISSTITTLMTSDESINVMYDHYVDEKSFSVSSAELKEILGDVPLASTQVVMWLKEYLAENIEELKK